MLERILGLGKHKESWHLRLSGQYGLPFREQGSSRCVGESASQVFMFSEAAVPRAILGWEENLEMAMAVFLLPASFLCYSTISMECAYYLPSAVLFQLPSVCK